ncbi:MAG TPA: lipopolysaccharide transport periplasmic protein LptA, partial [Oceanospirillaceae bacterium]|nr:lipopolysaccharide transport periplasmic protein LptA [Oceanospirillaceae bacterium]
MYLIKSITSAILLSYSLLASSTVAALDSDREQPIQIAADAAELNEGKGFSIYSGNVIITQGTMVIEASTVKITFDDNGIQTILAT